MKKQNARKLGLTALIAGASTLMYLQESIAQDNNPLNPFTQINNTSFEITNQLVTPTMNAILLQEHYGTKIFYGYIELTVHTADEALRFETETPSEERLSDTLDTVIRTLENYPPYMLKEKCNLPIVYLTTYIRRNQDELDGVAFSEGAIMINLLPHDKSPISIASIVHHEVWHACEFANVSDRNSFDDEWIQTSVNHGGNNHYVGREWRDLTDISEYRGYPRTYSFSEPVEHRATMWEDVMTRYNDGHERFASDTAYKMLFYRTIQLMRDWSSGMMDHEVYGLLGRGDIVDSTYYVEKFKDDAFRLHEQHD